MKAKTVLMVALTICLTSALVKASTPASISVSDMLNPWNPTMGAVEKAVDRTLSGRLPHAGEGFSNWSIFGGYDFGNINDDRPGGFENYFNSYTAGVDALWNNSTLWGLMGNYQEEWGRNDARVRQRTDVETWTYTLYMSRAFNDWMYYGASLSYGDTDNKIRGERSSDISTWAFSPYVSMFTKMDNWTFSLSPAYVLGCQDADYPGTAGDDTAMTGKLVVMGKASVALTEQLSLSGNLNFNQVLHNRSLDGIKDNDHQWFTYGVKLGYKFTPNLSGSFGWSSEFDSNFNSEIWNIGLAYAF